MTLIDQQNVPKLRFPEFDGEWEKSTLGKISTCLDTKRVPLKEGDRAEIRGDYPYYGASGVIDHVNDYLFDEPLVLLAEDGANIIMRSTPVAFVARGKYWVNNHAHVYRAHGSTEFLAEALERIDFTKYNTGTAQPKLNGEMCKKLPLTVPALPEQRKIAELLGAVDTKIAQLAEKKRLLEDYKKGCMQQLFSQKIRFKDDTGNDFPDWEEKRLGEIGEVRTSSVDKLSQENEKPVGLLNYMDVYRRDHIRQSDSFQKVTAPDGQIAAASLREGDVLFTPSSETPTDIGHSAVAMEDLPSVLFSYHLVRFRPNPGLLVPMFSGYAFKSHRFYVELWKRAQGATRYTLSKSALEESTVPLPHPDEQRKIADFLSALDRKIDLVGQELTHARSFKQGLLQQMFV